MSETESRSVVRSALRSAIRESDSLLLKSYAVVGTLLAGFMATLVVLALPLWINWTAEAGGDLVLLFRAGLLLAGVLAVGFTLAPLLFADRRRRDGRATVLRDRLYALSGYVFLLSIYLALVVSAPPEFRDEPSGPLAPAIELLYALPQEAAYAVLAGGMLAVLASEYALD